MDLKSAWASQINWAQIVGIAATIATIFGVKLTPELQVAVVATIQAIVALFTIIRKTFFTPTITPASAARMK